ncbi:hypothetical protein SOVF_108480 [Spinacia oleracea]|nr:hypothetical protein SOVF_108480 [Spinacia oleracea]
MACDILAIPITSITSESTFSAGGRVIEPHRACLGPDTVQMLLCGEDWLRNYYGIHKKKKAYCSTNTGATVVVIFSVAGLLHCFFYYLLVAAWFMLP